MASGRTCFPDEADAAEIHRDAEQALLIASHEDIEPARNHAAILDLTHDKNHEGKKQAAW